MTEGLDMERVTALLEELASRAESLLGSASWGLPAALEGAQAAADTVTRRMWGMADGVLGGTDGGASLWRVSAAEARYGGTGEAGGVSAITQNIYLTENDPSPYKTAKAIRRESEAMLRL